MQKLLRRIWKTVSRRTVRLLFFLPDEKRRSLERALRGKEELRKLQAADAVVVSHPKSGRTWLRVMLSRYFQLRYGIPERYMLGFDNFHELDERAPRIFFTHDTYLREYTGNRDSKRDFFGKKLVLLVRKPQDVAVSQFFQWKYRTRPIKKWLREYPEHGSEISLFDFVMNEGIGLPHIVDYMNRWAEALPDVENLLVVRYEDLRANPEAEFRRVADFLDGPAEDAQVKGAVEFGSVSNTRAMETKRSFWLSGSRLTPRDRKNPDSYKVRRAKVGGYRDYFDDDQLARIDDFVRSKLSPAFRYQDASAPRAREERAEPARSSEDPTDGAASG